MLTRKSKKSPAPRRDLLDTEACQQSVKIAPVKPKRPGGCSHVASFLLQLFEDELALKVVDGGLEVHRGYGSRFHAD